MNVLELSIPAAAYLLVMTIFFVIALLPLLGMGLRHQFELDSDDKHDERRT